MERSMYKELHTPRTRETMYSTDKDNKTFVITIKNTSWFLNAIILIKTIGNYSPSFAMLNDVWQLFNVLQYRCGFAYMLVDVSCSYNR